MILMMTRMMKHGKNPANYTVSVDSRTIRGKTANKL